MICYYLENKREITEIRPITAKDNILNLGEKTDYCYYAFLGVFYCNYVTYRPG